MFQTKSEKEILSSNFLGINGEIECEAPNNAIYKFNGSWTLSDNSKISLGID